MAHLRLAREQPELVVDIGAIPKPTVSNGAYACAFSVASPDGRSKKNHFFIAFFRALFSGRLFFMKGRRNMLQQNTKTNKTRLYAFVGVFSAAAFLLQVIGTLTGLKVGGFLDVEISDLPALIIAFAYGPLAGVLTELIKNLLHCTMTSTGLVGELANFVMTGTLCFVAGMVYKNNKTFQGAVLSLIFATLALAAAGVLANLFIMLPLYMPSAPFSVKMNLVLFTILPFNLVKGVVLSVLTLLLYKKISPILHK